MPVPAILSELLYHNEEFNMVCCKYPECLHALGPKMIVRHFAEKHCISLSIRKAIISFLKVIEQTISKDRYQHPAHKSLPQFFLKIVDNMHQCQSCGLVKANRLNLRQHINQEHGLKNFKNSDEIKLVSAQTWYPGKSASWWEVITEPWLNGQEVRSEELVGALAEAIPNNGPITIDSVDEEDRDLEGIMNAEEERIQEENILRWQIPNTLNPDQLSLWQQMTRWPVLFAKITRPLNELAALVNPPAKNGEESLECLEDILKDYILPRCLGTLERTPYSYLTWLKSPQADFELPRPFRAPQDTRTLKRYITYWGLYLCFIYRSIFQDLEDSVEEPEQEDGSYRNSTGLFLSPFQYLCMKKITNILEDHAHTMAADLEEETRDALTTHVFHFCLLSIGHQLHLHDTYRSPLMRFLAYMGINAQNGTLREPGEYTYVLSGVLYICRLFILEQALSQDGWKSLSISKHTSDMLPDSHEISSASTLAEDSTMVAFQALRRSWLVQGHQTPVASILRHLQYGLRILKMEKGAPVVTWNLEMNTLLIKAHPIHIETFKTAVHKIVHDCKTLLDELLLGLPIHIQLDKIVDSSSGTGHWAKAGLSFVTHPSNGLENGFKTMLKHAYKQKEARLLLEVDLTLGEDNIARKQVKWKKRRCQEYLEKEEDFLKLLLGSVHLTGGQPARGPEVGSIKHTNGQTSSRNIFVLHGRVALLTVYDKARAKRDTIHYIVRYLPESVSQLMVKYLVYVRPFARGMPGNKVLAKSNDYLWFNIKNPTVDRYVPNTFQRLMLRYMGLNIQYRNYRHVAIAIAREFLSEHLKVLGIDPEGTSNGPEDGDELLDSDENTILDLQASHTSKTASLHYALDGKYLNCLSEDLMRRFLHASLAWHKWLNIGPDALLDHGKRSCEISTPVDFPPSKRVKIWHKEESVLSQKHSPIELPDLQKALEKLYGPGAEFKSTAQLESIKFLVQGGKQGSIHVLGTGQGKSILFFILAILAQMETVLVIVPYTALLKDLYQRAMAHKIDIMQWNGQTTAVASLVLASAEQVVAPAFLEYANRLNAKNQLKHIFLDECHVALTDVSYRENLKHLNNLRLIDAPFACLTATLPPELESKLRAKLYLPQAHLLRSSTVQKNIQYRVINVQKVGIMPKVLAHVSSSKLSEAAGEKGIIFVRNKTIGTGLARVLNCGFYYSRAEDKDKQLEEWGKEGKLWIVATGALGTGMDISGICEVIHMDRPYGMINYLQQAGRGGRQERSTVATLYMQESSLACLYGADLLSGNSVEAIDEEALTRYMKSEVCRRTSIAAYMDGMKFEETGKTCLFQNVLPCDKCEREMQEAEPEHFSRIVFAVTQEDTPGIEALEDEEDRDVEDNEEEESDALEEPVQTTRNPTFNHSQSSLYSKEIKSSRDLYAKHQKKLAKQQGIRQKGLSFLRKNCVYCYVQHNRQDGSHEFQNCPQAVEEGGEKGWHKYLSWRRIIKFSDYEVCFKCGLPQYECGRDIAAKEECENQHLLFAVIFLLSCRSSFIKWLKGGTRAIYTGNDPAEYARWLASSSEKENTLSSIAWLFTKYLEGAKIDH